jgi:DNA-3-methyladenine glycosylase II
MSTKIADVLAHFAERDPLIHRELVRMDVKPLKLEKTPSLFHQVCETIIGQQLSGKAAAAIEERFERLFESSEATPETLAAADENTLREVGMSWAKVRSLKDLAKQTIDKTLDVEALPSLSDDEVLAHLNIVKGIGPWTAQMLLIFTLGREDVFSPGDLGLKKGLVKLYGEEVLESSKLEKKLASWSPFRSYACLALWHSLDNR